MGNKNKEMKDLPSKKISEDQAEDVRGGAKQKGVTANLKAKPGVGAFLKTKAPGSN